MSDRKPVFIVLAIGALITILVVFALDKSAPKEPTPPPATAASAASTDQPDIPKPPRPLKRPSMAVAEFAVLSDRPKADLDLVANPKNALALLKSQHCGDGVTCEAVKKFLLEENHLRLEVVDAKTWLVPEEKDLPRVGPTLTDKDRARLKKLTYVIRVLVSGPPQPSQLPARGGFALAGAIAEKVGGLVHDQVTDRLELPPQFVARAITAPLDQSAFKKNRIDYQFATREGGAIRLITAGMIRFGGPDLEIFGAQRSVVERLADVLGALCESIAGGAKASPITITLSDVERARGAKFDDALAMPPPMPIEIDVEDVPPENGDPSDVMARVIPPDGPSPEGYEDLAASFFGMDPSGPTPFDEVRATKEKAQKMLPAMLEKYSKLKSQGAALFLEIPFPTDADGGQDPLQNPDAFDFLSLEVTAYDATTITGTVYEDPAGAFGVKKGDTLTRKRTEVTDYVLRLPDGGMESASMPE